MAVISSGRPSRGESVAGQVLANDAASGGGFALHCRGDVRLYAGEVDCTPTSKKGRALLAILAAEQRPLVRTRIIDLLWSDRQEEQARASLRTLLADLREQFGDRFDKLLVVDRERVALGPSVRTDLLDPSLARPAGELFEGLDHIDPELDEWLRLEREKWANGAAPALPASPAASPQGMRGLPGWALVAAFLLALAAGAFLYFRPWAEPEQPVIAVLPLRDATGQNALLAEGLAEDLRVHLAERDGLQVIGRQSSEVPAIVSAGAVGARRMLGATHLVEGSVLPGRPARLSVRLIDAAGGKVIWNHVSVAQPNLVTYGPNGLAKLIADQVTDTVGQVGPAHAFDADPASYQKLFEARRMLARLDSTRAPEARQLLLAVVDRNPNFAPALAALAEATFRSSNHPFYRGPMPLQSARKEAERYALQAVKLAPDFGQAWLALGQARLDTPQAIEPLRRAVRLSPGSFRARYRLARALETSGDLAGAIHHQRVAMKLEPLDPNAALMLMQYLAYFDDRDEIRRVLSEFTAKSEDRYDELDVAGQAATMVGDYSSTLTAALEQVAIQPDDEQAHRAAMWGYLQLSQHPQALPHADAGSISALLIADDLEGVLTKIRSLGPDFWLMNFETRGAAEYLVSKNRNRELVDAYFRAGRALSEDRMGAEALIVALRKEKHNVEADRLLEDYYRWTEKGTAGLPGRVRDFSLASYYALAGQRQRALAALERTRELDWSWLAALYQPVVYDAAFQSLRDEPRFRALSGWFYSELNRERREAAIALRKLGKAEEADALAMPVSASPVV